MTPTLFLPLLALIAVVYGQKRFGDASTSPDTLQQLQESLQQIDYGYDYHADVDIDWAYRGEIGPWQWAAIGKCAGMRQSPINIVRSHAIIVPPRTPLLLSNYDYATENWEIHSRNGKRVEVWPHMRQNPTLSGGGLPTTFDLHHFHFHLGDAENPGSEHLLDYKRYPAEIHIMHVNRQYVNGGGNRSTSNWNDHFHYAVLAILVDIDDKDNARLEPLLTAMRNHHLDASATTTTLSSEAFSLQSLLPSGLAAQEFGFYRYYGSLTTPPCDETVIWTVLHEPLRMSRRQLYSFFSSGTDGKQALVNNWRPAQALNDRVVLSSAPPASQWSFVQRRI